jgi:hypothetical protein
VAKQKFLKVIHHELNGESGIMHVRVCSVEVDDENPNQTNEGPHKLFGIDHNSLQTFHGGDLEKWVLSLKPEMVRLHEAHQCRRDKLEEMKGKMF